MQLASRLGIELTEQEAVVYRSAMMGTINAYQRLDELVEFRPPVKYPRTPGYRPSQAEDPYNAWYRKTEIEGAKEGPLKGCRVGVKDTISVAGVPMINGSPALEGYIPEIDATVVTRLLDAGAIIAGKTNSSDHSFSSGGHTSAYGPVRNPRRPTHAPGGSSKGSAAAIAAGDVDMALGGDQGGSIRIPASWCGVVGHKPTYGLVPYTGCLPIEMTIDHVGPMGKSVESVARLLSVLAGPDSLDPRQQRIQTFEPPAHYLDALGRDVKGMRIAVVKEGFGQTAADWSGFGLPASDPIVDKKVKAAIQQLEKRGAIVSEVSVPMHITAMNIWYGIFVEGATELMLKGNSVGTNWWGFYDTHFINFYSNAWRARANDLAHGVKITLLLGEYMNTHYHGRYYAKAQNLRHLVKKAYDEILSSYDVMVMPTTVILPRPIPDANCDLQEWIYSTLCMIHNCPQTDLSGHPAISIPCGMHDGLPVGMMIIGKHFEDSTVIRLADAFERIGDWRTM